MGFEIKMFKVVGFLELPSKIAYFFVLLKFWQTDKLETAKLGNKNSSK